MVNGRIDKYQFEEGYCQAEKGSYYTSRDNFTFCYYDQDHLGNIRQVREADGSKKGEVIQAMNYYPFGAEFCDNSTKNYTQKHKYNGKEFDNMHGLNSYDYGARQYNPVTARWDRIDPLAEKYYSVSPYNYCHNNPTNRIDIDGRDDYFSNTGKFLYTKGNGSNIYIQQGKGFNNFNSFDLRSTTNRQMAANVVGYYAHQAGADKNYNGQKGVIGVSTLHKYDGVKGALAGTRDGNIYVKFTNGFFNNELYNKYNLIGMFIHEKEHKKDQQTGTYPSSDSEIPASHHAEIIIKEMSSDNFSQCSESYQDGQMGYLGKFVESVLETNPSDAHKLAREANKALAKIGWEMYYKNGNAYFRQIE